MQREPIDNASIMLISPCNEHPIKPHSIYKDGACRDIHYFHFLALKHRLWVLVRTALMRRF